MNIFGFILVVPSVEISLHLILGYAKIMSNDILKLKENKTFYKNP